MTADHQVNIYCASDEVGISGDARELRRLAYSIHRLARRQSVEMSVDASVSGKLEQWDRHLSRLVVRKVTGMVDIRVEADDLVIEGESYWLKEMLGNVFSFSKSAKWPAHHHFFRDLCPSMIKETSIPMVVFIPDEEKL